MNHVRTRIPPSPTGTDLHLGNVYTALFNYVFAKKHKGEFILRIEDTDRTRYVEGTEQRILDSLKWVGISYDEGPDISGPYAPYRQSERLAIYKTHAEQLIASGHAYYCFCTPVRLDEMRKQQQAHGRPTMYDGTCKTISLSEAQKRIITESYVIRLKVPDSGETIFTDLIRGKIHFQNELIDDQVLIKSDGFPTYHLAVVVDDHLMQITHVIRGEDWISSTPKHVLLYWAFGWTLPYFAHLPLLRNTDKSKLSKRKNPVWTSWYRQHGFVPEAILNYLGTMTWSMPDGRDIFSIKEMIAEFDLKNIKTTSPIFDIEKLTWLNGEYIRSFTNKELRAHLTEFIPKSIDSKLVTKLVPLAKMRMKKLTEFVEYLKPFISFTHPTLADNYKKLLPDFVVFFNEISAWKTKEIEVAAKKVVAQKNISMRDSFMALRLAVTGEKIGLPLFETCEILGKKEVLERIHAQM